MHALTLPESVFDYMTKEGIRSVVDHLLATRTADFPEEIASWQQARDYHRALLAAYQVRQEHIMFLFDLWDAVWKTALDETDFAFTVVDFTEQHRDYDRPSPAYFWSEYHGHFRQITGSRGDRPIAELGVEYWPGGIKLYLYHTEGIAHVPEALPAPWSPEFDEDGCQSTNSSAAVPRGRELDQVLGVLVDAAKSCLRTLWRAEKSAP